MELEKLYSQILPAFSEEALAALPENERGDYKNYKIFPVELLVKAQWNYKEDNDFLSEKLRENLKRNGQTETIHVRRLSTGYYEVINGNHRFDEAVALGRKTLIAFDHGAITREEAIRHTIETNETKFAAHRQKLAELMGSLKQTFGLEDLVETLPYHEEEINNLAAMVEGTAGDTLFGNEAGAPGSSEAGSSEVLTPPAKLSLAERFICVPLTILDTRRGEWQERKRKWLALGIKSEVGRGENLLGFSETHLKAQAGELERNTDDAVLYKSLSARVPDFYEQKTEWEKRLGRELSYSEFKDNYLVIPEGSGLSSGGTSVFDPALTELAVQWFSPPGGKVLDTFAGGSVRGIVAAACGRAYTGIELRSEQIAANREQWTEILPRLQESTGKEEFPAPRWIEGNSLKQAELLDKGEEFDFIFSCPPYFDLEVYSENPEDLSTLSWEEFKEQYCSIIRQAVDRLKENRFACFVVGDVRDKEGFYRGFHHLTVQAFEEAGAKLYNEMFLINPAGSLPIRIGSWFANYRKVGKTHQNVYVFYKGDPKKVSEFFPELIEETFANVREEEKAPAPIEPTAPAPEGGEIGEDALGAHLESLDKKKKEDSSPIQGGEI